LLCFPPLRKTTVASLVRVFVLRSSFLKRVTLDLSGGRRMLGRDARLPSQCRYLLSKRQLLTPASRQAQLFVGYYTDQRFSHSVRDTDILLHPPERPPVSAANDSPFDAERMVVDTPSLAETPLQPPSPSQKSAHNGGSPAPPRSAPCNFQATDSLFGSPKAGPSRVSLEHLTSVPSLPIDAMEVTRGEMNQSPSFHELDLLFDFQVDASTADRQMSSLSRSGQYHECIAESPLTNANHGGPPDHSSPTVQRAVEPTCADGTASFEVQSPLVDIHVGQSAHGPIFSPESGGPNHQLSCSVSSPNLKPSKSLTPQADTNEPVTTSGPPDIVPSCPPLLPCGGDSPSHMPFPQPPPEVTTLLMAHSSSDVVSAVFSRNSPLVPWELPSEIGYFWLGLFKISEVKVTYACHCQATDLTSLWIYLFARWKRTRGEAPRPQLQSGVPGALFWNGCRVARIYSWMMSSMTTANGSPASCGHGGSRSPPCRTKVFLPNAPACCFHFHYSLLLQRTRRQLVTSQLAGSAPSVDASTCNASYDIESARAIHVRPR